MLSKNVILVDALYADSVAADMMVNFERMIGRRIPCADMPRWLDCVVLDGGVVPGENSIDVIFIYDKKRGSMPHFVPSDIEDLNGKAFNDNLGEFSISSYSIADDVTNREDFFMESLKVLVDSKKVERLMVVADMLQYGGRVTEFLDSNSVEGKSVSLFSMSPQAGKGFAPVVLGYSLMNAMGISGDELR